MCHTVKYVLAMCCYGFLILAGFATPVAAASAPSPTRLITIDDPEIIPEMPASGVLYDGMLTAASTRIYLFTSLASTKPPQPDPAPRDVRLTLTNTAAESVDVGVLGEARGPNGQPTTVGQIELACFFIHRYRIDTKTYHLAPGGSVVLLGKRLSGSGSTVSGIFDLTTRQGAVRVTAVATEPGSSSSGLPPFAEVKPWRSGVFDLTDVLVTKTAVNVGQPAAPVLLATIGDDCHPTPSVNDGRRKPTTSGPGGYLCAPTTNSDGYFDLHGDYGVLRTYEIDASNTANTGASLSLYARPRGGNFFETFLLNDQMIQVAGVRTAWLTNRQLQSYEIASVFVPPGGSKAITIQTMGQGESALPADLLISKTQTGIPQAPRPQDGFYGSMSALAAGSACAP